MFECAVPLDALMHINSCILYCVLTNRICNLYF